jgi:acyl-CoA oxidase
LDVLSQILDYDNVQQTLLPLIAKAYALKFMGKRMMDMYEGFDAARDRGDFSSLPELHALSSGLKSLCTDVTAGGIETCRRTCGGQGFSVLSGLPTLFASYVQNVTWEGDNNVMYLQTARFIVKALLTGSQDAAGSGSAAYLSHAFEEAASRCRVARSEEWRDPESALAGLRHVAARLALLAMESLRMAGGGKPSVEGAPWNATTVDLIRAARAHCCLNLHQTFVEGVNAAAENVSSDVLCVLRDVAALHGVSLLDEVASDLLEGNHASGQQTAWLREQKRQLTRQLRPNAVALVDSFGYEDYLLNSAIGRSDGDVYRALLEAAKISPLNDTEEGPAWKPVLEGLLSPTARRSKL